VFIFVVLSLINVEPNWHWKTDRINMGFEFQSRKVVFLDMDCQGNLYLYSAPLLQRKHRRFRRPRILTSITGHEILLIIQTVHVVNFNPYNALGQRVMSTSSVPRDGTVSFRIREAPDVYLYRMKTDMQSFAGKIVMY